MTPEQGAILARCFRIGLGDLQGNILRGDEDDRLVVMLDAFDAYFALCRIQLGHDRVPTATLETYVMIRDRKQHLDKR